MQEEQETVLGTKPYQFIILKVIQIVSRQALMKCPLLHGNIQKETDRLDRQKKVCYDFRRFRDSAVQNNSLNDGTQHSLEPTQILFKRPQLSSTLILAPFVILLHKILTIEGGSKVPFKSYQILWEELSGPNCLNSQII